MIIDSRIVGDHVIQLVKTDGVFEVRVNFDLFSPDFYKKSSEILHYEDAEELFSLAYLCLYSQEYGEIIQ